MADALTMPIRDPSSAEDRSDSQPRIMTREAQSPRSPPRTPPPERQWISRTSVDHSFVRGVARVTNWPVMPRSPVTKKRGKLYDEYGFPKTPSSSTAKVSPATAVAKRKLVAGVITQQEHDHIVRIINLAMDNPTTSGSNTIQHESKWDEFVDALKPDPAAFVSPRASESPPHRKNRAVYRDHSPVHRHFLSAGKDETSGSDEFFVDVVETSLQRSLSMPSISAIGGALGMGLDLSVSVRSHGLSSDSGSAARIYSRRPSRIGTQISDSRRTSIRRSRSLPTGELSFRIPKLNFTSETKSLKDSRRSQSFRGREQSVSHGLDSIHYSRPSSRASLADSGIENSPSISSTTPMMEPTPMWSGDRSVSPVDSATEQIHTVHPRPTSPDDPRSAWSVMLSYRFPIDGSQVQELIEGGIPPSYRSFVWHHLISGYVFEERLNVGAGYYQAISNAHAQSSKRVQRSIEEDLLRTFPDNCNFNKIDNEAIKRLRRVLTAFSRRNPSIGYCQGFNFIAAFALLVLPEESAFWCMVAIVEHIMPQGYFSGSLSSARTDQQVMRRVVERWCPEISAALREHEFDLSVVSFSWFMTLFVDDMSHNVTLRIWDQLLLKGSIVLFQSAFAFLKLAEPVVLAATSRLQLFSVMLSLSRRSKDVDRLMVTATQNCPIDWGFINHHRKMCLSPNILRCASEVSMGATKRMHASADEALSNVEDDDLVDILGVRMINGDEGSPCRLKLNFPDEDQVYWFESLCSSTETRAVFVETVKICHALAGSRGITYLKLKHELEKHLETELVQRNKEALVTILKTHENRIEATQSNASSESFKFDDVVLYPALVMVNKLDVTPAPFEILYEQAMLSSTSGGPMPPSPDRLPPNILANVRQAGELARQFSAQGELSEQLFRNRTAELCACCRDGEPHYMTVKRKLINEFGATAFDKFKRVVQSVFRTLTDNSGGMFRTKSDGVYAGQHCETVSFEAGHVDLSTTAVCTLFVPSDADDASSLSDKATVWCGTSDGTIDVLSRNGKRISVKRHASTTTCMTLYHDQVWSGSHDGSICITSRSDLGLIATLYEATGSILSMFLTKVGNRQSDRIWCGTSSGQLLEYSADTRTLHRTVTLPVPIGFYAHRLPHAPDLTGVHETATEPEVMDVLNGKSVIPERRFVPMTILSVDENMWIGTGRHIIVIQKDNRSTLKHLSGQSTVDGKAKTALDSGQLIVTGEDQVSIECNSSLCLASPRQGDVWSCSYCDPYMFVWNSEEDKPIKKQKIPVPWGSRGIRQLLSTMSCVWGVSGDGSVLVWNTEKYEQILTISLESIPISCVAKYGDNEVAGVSKQSIHSLVVWRA